MPIMEQIKDLEQQIASIKTRREKDLRYRKLMSSRPSMTHSYGNYEQIESKVIEKYDTMIEGIQRQIDALKNVNPTGKAQVKRRKVMYTNDKEPKLKSTSNSSSNSMSGDQSVESSFSCNCNSKESNYNSDDDDSSTEKSQKGSGQDFNDQEMIEIESSSSSSDDESSNYNIEEIDGKSAQNDNDIADAEEDAANDDANSNLNIDNTTEDDSNANDPSSEAEEIDDETVINDMKQCYAPEIKNSKLFMAAQGFQSNRNSISSGRQSGDKDTAPRPVPVDHNSIEFAGRKFVKNKCYVLKTGGLTVGIKKFTSSRSCQCILISKFEDTILGLEDARVTYKADYSPESHVQVFKCEKELSLKDLGKESDELSEIPSLIYEPQTPGNWYSFGYFFDRNRMKKKGRRKGLTSLELLAGAGGSLQGYHNAGFKTVMAVEDNEDAVLTLRENNKGIKVYDKCIKTFVKDYPTLTCALGRIIHIHFSSPCQDFSTANRAVANSSEIVGPRERADLSLLLIDLIRLTSCDTAVFENVVGIWRKNNVHYLFNIAKEIIKLGYQVRCTVLHACDYGDAQKRPRFFMFIAKNNVPMPSIPPATHGSDSHLWPYVTVKDVLSKVSADKSLPNMQGGNTKLKPGQHGHVRLDANDVAPTLRCSGGRPFHYSEDRLITVREAVTLQSFPLDYKFHGDIGSQYRQVGNAIPVELSTAVAQTFRNVLLYEYE